MLGLCVCVCVCVCVCTNMKSFEKNKTVSYLTLACLSEPQKSLFHVKYMCVCVSLCIAHVCECIVCV